MRCNCVTRFITARVRSPARLEQLWSRLQDYAGSYAPGVPDGQDRRICEVCPSPTPRPLIVYATCALHSVPAASAMNPLFSCALFPSHSFLHLSKQQLQHSFQNRSICIRSLDSRSICIQCSDSAPAGASRNHGARRVGRPKLDALQLRRQQVVAAAPPSLTCAFRRCTARFIAVTLSSCCVCLDQRSQVSFQLCQRRGGHVPGAKSPNGQDPVQARRS